jgi:hypothetical protein
MATSKREIIDSIDVVANALWAIWQHGYKRRGGTNDPLFHLVETLHDLSERLHGEEGERPIAEAISNLAAVPSQAAMDRSSPPSHWPYGPYCGYRLHPDSPGGLHPVSDVDVPSEAGPASPG